MRCLKLLYSKTKMPELIIVAAFALLVIVLMIGLLPFSETVRYCNLSRSAFNRTDNILYFTSNAPDEYVFGKTEVTGINDVDLPFEKDGSIFTTSLYSILAENKDEGSRKLDANGNPKPICINLICYSTYDWNNLLPGIYESAETGSKDDMIGLWVSQELVDKHGYKVGDQFKASVETGIGGDRSVTECAFYVEGIIKDDAPIMSLSQCLSTETTMERISVNRDKYRGSDVLFAVGIDPNGILPETSDRYMSALISVPEGYRTKTVTDKFNEEYLGKAKLMSYDEIEAYTLRASWNGRAFQVLLLIALGTVLLTSFTGFTVTKTDRMRQTIKNLYINGLSRTKILTLFFTYYMTLIVPAFVIGLAVFPVLASEEFHGYNPLIITGSALLFAFFLLAGTLITLFSLRKNLIITYDKA